MSGNAVKYLFAQNKAEKREDKEAQRRSFERSMTRRKAEIDELENERERNEKDGGPYFKLERREVLRGAISQKRMGALKKALCDFFGLDFITGFLGGCGIGVKAAAIVSSDDIFSVLFGMCLATEFEVAELIEVLVKEGTLKLDKVWISSDDGHLILSLGYYKSNK